MPEIPILTFSVTKLGSLVHRALKGIVSAISSNTQLI